MTAPSTVVLERPAGKRIAKAGSFCANANPQARQHNTRAALRMRTENLMNRWYQVSAAPQECYTTSEYYGTNWPSSAGAWCRHERTGSNLLISATEGDGRASDSAARGQVQTNRS